MKKPTINGRLNHAETARLDRAIARVAQSLREAGLKTTSIEKRLQTDLQDVFQRLSMACPYEQARIQYMLPPILLKALDKRENLHLVSLGRPQDRVPVGSLKKFDPENLNRQFRRGIAKLRAQGVKHLKIFAVLEVQLVQPLDAAPFWEPHMHLIVQGPTADQLRQAFKVRKLAATTCRKRPLHVEPIWGLDGIISYCLKFHPKVQNQYQTEAGLRWRENRLPSEYLPQWFRFMSRHSLGEMLKFVGINGHELMQQLTCELSLDFSEIPRGRR